MPIKVIVSYWTWPVDESPKAYFQPSPWQVVLVPLHPVKACTAGNSTQMSYHPELNASRKLRPSRDRTRIAHTVVQPANLCTTEFLCKYIYTSKAVK